jgi:hypothetical protein
MIYYINLGLLCAIKNDKKEIYKTDYLRKGSLTTKIAEFTRCSAHTGCFLLQGLIPNPLPMTKINGLLSIKHKVNRSIVRSGFMSIGKYFHRLKTH